MGTDDADVRLNLAELEESGLYDPSADDAAETLEYLEWLTAQGFDVVELAETTELAHLASATAALGIRPDARPLAAFDNLAYGRAEVSSMAGVFGFSQAMLDRGMFTPGEVEILSAALAGGSLYTEEEAHYFARIAGQSLARIADAAMSLFVIDVEGPVRGAGLTRTEDAKLTQEAIALLAVVTDGLEPLFRLHMAQAIERLHWSAAGTGDPDAVRQAIGFVDLVGFTTLASSVSLSDLGLLVREFEARAYELVARCGARVVKTIGDAVMFCAIEPSDVAAAARSLILELGSRAGVEARAGLAYGDVLTRGGDYYGPIVNLASRLTDEARPGEILTTESFAAATGTDHEFVASGVRQLKGFATGVDSMSLRGF